MTRFLVILASLPVLLSSGRAVATSMLRQDISSLTQSSDAVIRGTVKDTQSRWSADHKRIITAVTIEVAEFYKGSGVRTLVIQQPGGEIDGIGQKVSGLASFQPGEEVVLFVERLERDTYRVVGMAQGKYRVERSSDKRAAFAVPESADDALLIDPSTRERVESDRKPLELDALKAKVRAASKRTGDNQKLRKAP